MENYTCIPARKPRTIKGMRAFLLNHKRYFTRNGWNRLSSFAVVIKIGHLRLTSEEHNKCSDLLTVEDCHELSGFNEMLRDFAVEQHWNWQIGINGRSGGYAVLYKSSIKDDGYKSVCCFCGQRNETSVTETGTRCGRCGKTDGRHDYGKLPHTSHVVSCETVGDNVDEMTSFEIRELFKTVWAFDLAVEDATRMFVDYAMSHEVVEETIMVPKKVMAAKEI